MKRKKLLLFAFILPISLGFIFQSIIELYTKDTIQKLAYQTAKSSTFNRGWDQWVSPKGNVTVLPAPLYLGNMLYANIHANKPDSILYWGAGKYTEKSYKDNWRKLLADNPILAYKALENYGEYFITEFNESLLKIRDSLLEQYKDNKRVTDSLNEFSLEKYWDRQMMIFEKYEDLTNELLQLDNNILMTFINKVGKEQYPCCGKGPPATELHAWLLYKNLIGKIPYNLYNYTDDPINNGGWYYEKYPVDLLLLTYRIHKDYPTWHPRTFLKEVQEFSGEVKKMLLSEEDSEETDNEEEN